MIQLIKQNLSRNQSRKEENLFPYCFYTDGGAYNDETYYFIQNIFSRSTICYSTKLPKNSHIQAYLGRKVVCDASQVPPKNYKIKNSQDIVMLPYEQYVDKNEDECYKLLTELVIHNMGWGYTCFCSAYMIFVSEKPIKIQKSEIIQMFNDINSVEKFEELGFPILNSTQCSDGSSNRAFEIDLSQKNLIKKIAKVKKLDCYPLLFVASFPSKTEYSVKFKQKIAAKYLVLKLIDSYKHNLNDNNIDMYNLTLNGIKLQIPQS
ncbi:UNKNOWN [Stylonychia lemnae]|uniref:Uncharacterized protein n=1 Tax=Stylonychia lemnae TaxID=5949 RepID=A0A078AT16_STYLE|nr:UNKNOWN [Stylonychia lemnae]|eukprot:CDW85600.1 UNKNOWN [Stylonychia lemnae]